MELYKELLVQILAQQDVQVTFSNCSLDLNRLVESAAYQAICRIRALLEDDSLDDRACFKKIEEIVCIFEDMGSSGGGRHDFG